MERVEELMFLGSLPQNLLFMKNEVTYDISIPQLWQYINGTASEALKRDVELALLHQDEYWPLYDGLIRLQQDFGTEEAVFEYLDHIPNIIAQQLGIDNISL